MDKKKLYTIQELKELQPELDKTARISKKEFSLKFAKATAHVKYCLN